LAKAWLFSRNMRLLFDQINRWQAEDRYRTFHQNIGVKDGPDHVMRQYKSESDPTKNHAVEWDAGGIAGENAQPLVPFSDAALPQMVNFGVEEFAEDFGNNARDDNSPYRSQDCRKLPAQTPGRVLGQPGGEMKKKRHEKVNGRRQNNHGLCGGLPEALVDQIPDGECQWINESAGVHTEAGNQSNFQAGNIRQQLSGNIDRNDNNPSSWNGSEIFLIGGHNNL